MLLSPTKFPVFHASLISLMIFMALASFIINLLAYKKFLKGPFKSYICLIISSSFTLLLFFSTYLLFEMDYHKLIDLGNIELILSLGFISAIISFVLTIIASIKIYKISSVFGFSKK